MSIPLRLMGAAEEVVDELNRLLDISRPRLLSSDQLRESAGSITSNIREAYGRRAGPERNQFFRFSAGSVEETDDRVKRNYAARRIATRKYWWLHNRLAVIKKMLDALMTDR